MNELKRLVFSGLTLAFICLLYLTPSAWAQSDGVWRGISNEGGDAEFHVNGSQVEGFSIYAYLTGGSAGSGWLWLAVGPAMPISGNSFSFSGSLFDVTGTFTGSSTSTGTYDYHDPYLGYSSGTWTANFFTDPYITLSPSSQNFGDYTINTTSSAVTFTLSNIGGGSATGSVSLVGTNADQFEITSGGGSFSLSRDQSKDIYVRFAPTSAGWKTATLMVDGDSPCNDESASLMGTGKNPMSLSVTPNYHIVSASADSTTFTVTNEGDGTMSWTAETDPDDTWLNITDGNFGTNSGTITVSYEANDGDARIGSITVTADGAVNNPQTVELLQAEGRPSWWLTASDKASYDYFGQAVSISGDQAIVGASGDDDNGSSSGSAYIFEKTGSGWIQQAKLTASDGASNDGFGVSVSISGDQAIVVGSSGSAYIFNKPVGGWVDMTETAKLTASDGASNDYFGRSVSISGDQVIVGAYGDDDNGSDSGSAYIFNKPVGGWVDMTETAKLTASDGASNDYFGRSVSISGDQAIVGARSDDDNWSDSGSAYVFERTGSGWIQRAKLTASDGATYDYFGVSVSISGDQAIVGAFFDDDNGSSSGSAYIFEKTGSGWIQRAKLTASDGASNDYFGVSVSISGNQAIVGAYRAGYSGSAYIFKKPVGGWVDMTETAKVTNFNGYYGPENFGESVSISGDQAIVGDKKFNYTGYSGSGYNSGAAHIYYMGNVSLAVSDIKDQIISENTTLNDISLTIFDSETPAEDLILTGISSNSTLVPNENIVLEGTGVNRTITITPAPNSTGTTTITVTLSDGTDTASDSFLLTVIVAPNTDGDGNMASDDLWIRAVIKTEEKGDINAVWQKKGDAYTDRGDRVIWGYFHASPHDVTWGSENNPDLFVKIWFDVSGRIDVNYFHVSVPDIEVYSDYPYDGTADEHGTTTMSRRYIRQYYENGESNMDESYEDGNPPSGYSPAGNPSGYSTINDLRIGSIINTVEKGPIDALWRLGGQDTTSRGDQVVWGHFYASPSDVTWGSQNNPDLFVKIWFDLSGRVDVNFFHVSVPDIEVYSDLPDEDSYDQKETTIMDNRYIRHEYWR